MVADGFFACFSISSSTLFLGPAPPNQRGLSPAPSTATAVQHDEQLQPG